MEAVWVNDVGDNLPTLQCREEDEVRAVHFILVAVTVGDAERGLARRIAGCSMIIFNAKTRPRLKHHGRIHASGEVLALRRGRPLKSNMPPAEAARRTPSHHVRPIHHTRILTRYFRLRQ